MITKPQNVYVMRDIMCSGYVAGGNCRWFGAGPTESNTLDGPVSNENFAADLNARLSFEDDASGEYASMMAFACPYNEVETASRDQVISISERLLPWEVAKNADPAKKYFPGGADGYNLYKAKWALGQIHFGEDVRATESMSFMSQGAVNNALCFIGPHRRYNPFAQNFYELVPGQGHFGPDAIPGDVRRHAGSSPPHPTPCSHVLPRSRVFPLPQARWRRGESVSLKAARDSMVSLEVAAHSQLALRPAIGI